MSAQDSAPIIKEGWCIKLGGVFKTWRKRWFVLQGATLKYYSAKDEELKGEIQIKPDNVISKYPQCKKPHAFSINTENRLYQIAAPSEEELDEWIKVLNNAKVGKSPSKKVTLNDFIIIKTLGQGTYGKVTLVQNKSDRQYYALKSISKELLQKYNLIDSTIRERDTLMTIHHPFLVSAHYSFQNDTYIFLAQEFIPGGDLFSRLRDVSILKEKQAQYYCAMLLLGIGELHKHKIIHRDLKPDNILLDQTGYIKISDFGLVKFGVADGNAANTFCGTPDYMAPEIIQHEPYGAPVDWWALGILTYQMLFGFPTFFHNNRNEMYKLILKEEPEYPEETDISSEAIDFINKLLIKNPNNRLGSGGQDYIELQQHPWFNGFQWDMLLDKQIKMDYIPHIEKSNLTEHFDHEFTSITPGPTPVDPDLINSGTQRAFQDFTLINDEA